MELSPLGWLAIIFPVASTIVFFVLGKSLSPSRRFFASIHGVTGLAILPATMFATTLFAGIGETGGMIIMLMVGAVAATSAFYAIATVRTRWYFQLLHVPTFAVIAGGFVYTAFFLAGH